MRRKAGHMAGYMRHVEQCILASRPDLAGRLPWQEFYYGYYQGWTAEKTAQAWLLHAPARQGEPEDPRQACDCKRCDCWLREV